MQTQMRNRAWLELSVVILAAVALVVGVCWAAENAERPKVLGIAYVTFKTTDLEKAKAFYEAMGLPSVAAKNGNGVQASFAVNPYQRVNLVNEAGSGGSFLVEVGLATNDVAKMRAYLTAKGVPADRIGKWADGTEYFVTGAPEGNRLVFVQETNWGKGGVPEGSISHKLIHAGFIVKNAAVEDGFYKDVLGFHVYWHGGMKEDETQWMAMQVPDGTDWIEYMLRIPENPDKRTRGVMNHISLGVTSIQETEKEIEKNGVTGHEEPKIGRDGKWQLNLYDPDFTRVEFMEFTPKEKPCCSPITGTAPGP